MADILKRVRDNPGKNKMLSDWWRQTLGQWVSTGVEGWGILSCPGVICPYLEMFDLSQLEMNYLAWNVSVADMETPFFLEHICTRFDFEQITLALWRPLARPESDVSWDGEGGLEEVRG